MGCPLRWSWEEAERRGPLALLFSLSFYTCQVCHLFAARQEQCPGRALISGCFNVGTVSLCLETDKHNLTSMGNTGEGWWVPD